jgi:hypothetical protein
VSRLLNYGVGEIVDRLTILELKILTGTEKGYPLEHWETERTQLLTKIHARTLNGAWFDHVLGLAGINAMIWHAEDDLRAWRSPDHVYTMADLDLIRILAFRLQTLNDRRAELVYRINKEAGDGDTKDKG